MAKFDVREWPAGGVVSSGISAASFSAAIETFAGKSVVKTENIKSISRGGILYERNYKLITTIGGDQYSVHKRVKSWTD